MTDENQGTIPLSDTLLTGSHGATEERSAAFSVEDFLKNLRQELAPSVQSVESGEKIAEPASGELNLMEQYASAYEARGPLLEDALHILNKASDSAESTEPSWHNALRRFLYPRDYQAAAGGFFFRWKNKGVVINPGRHFLDSFHNRGLYVRDIDYVIVTDSQNDCYDDIKAIYALNYEQNRLQNSLHIINYYIHREAYQQVVANLKPHFKQERATIHPLEFYIDSSEAETLFLGDAIRIDYFSAGSAAAWAATQTAAPLGLRAELLSNDEPQLVVSWFLGTYPKQGSRAFTADLFITSSDENGLLQFPYHLCQSAALKGVAPLLLCSETGNCVSDQRLHLTRKLRQEKSTSGLGALLPADSGLTLQLPYLRTKCTLCQTESDAADIRVIKSRRQFGSLHYLCADCAL